MPKFQYLAQTADGTERSGSVDAVDSHIAPPARAQWAACFAAVAGSGPCDSNGRVSGVARPKHAARRHSIRTDRRDCSVGQGRFALGGRPASLAGRVAAGPLLERRPDARRPARSRHPPRCGADRRGRPLAGSCAGNVVGRRSLGAPGRSLARVHRARTDAIRDPAPCGVGHCVSAGRGAGVTCLDRVRTLRAGAADGQNLHRFRNGTPAIHAGAALVFASGGRGCPDPDRRGGAVADRAAAFFADVCRQFRRGSVAAGGPVVAGWKPGDFLPVAGGTGGAIDSAAGGATPDSRWNARRPAPGGGPPVG